MGDEGKSERPVKIVQPDAYYRRRARREEWRDRVLIVGLGILGFSLLGWALWSLVTNNPLD
jgi:hypothetical protein